MSTKAFDLPAELLIEIFRFCHIPDLVKSIPLVSKRWKEATESVELWRYLCDSTSIAVSLTDQELATPLKEWQQAACWHSGMLIFAIS